MDEARMETALTALSKHMPRAPSELVDDMAKTVNAFEAEKSRRLGTKQPEAAPERTQQPIHKQHGKGMGK